MSDDKQNRTIDDITLTNLFNADLVATRAAAEERGAIASRIKGLIESHGLDGNAYRIAKNIAKLPTGKREHLKRAVDLYCRILGVGEQMDLEEAMDHNVRAAGGATELEAAMDGKPRGSGTVKTPSINVRPDTPAGNEALDGFTKSMDEATTVPACNTGLDRFTKDYPYLAEKAASIAIKRITAIELAASDGEEDVRPDHLKNAGTKEATEIAAANAKAGKTPAKPKRATKTPAEPKPKSTPRSSAPLH